MKTWITLIRGINVGGKNILPMKDLRVLLESLGCENVQTYIQSGNCVFDSATTVSASISKRIRAAIADEFGFSPMVLSLTAAELSQAIKQNPYDTVNNEPKCIHFFFLEKTAKNADLDALTTLKHPNEEFLLTKKVFYLFAPDGISRSKLAAGAEAKLGVGTTARNYKSVAKLADLSRRL